MKKSLIALAVLGSLAGVAQAQSSVTLYGIADVWFGRDKQETPAGSTSTTRLNSGGLASSRFGLQGTEDLGGGLKAIFKLEQGFNADNGTVQQNNTAFDRQAWVGLEGGFGTVQFGNIWSAFDDVYAIGNSIFDSGAFSPSYDVLSVAGYNDRPRNGLRYTSPSFGGVSFAVSHSLDENAAAKNDQTDFNVQYAGGPLTVAFAYQLRNDFAGVGADRKHIYLTGAYDFGVAVLKGGVGQSRNFNVAKSKDWQIGADFPLSSALTLSTGYARSKDEPTADRRAAVSVGALYALSKRTATYAGFKRVKEENAAGTTTSRDTVFGVGVQHKF